MRCKQCADEAVINISAKCGDLFQAILNDKSYHGSVPSELGIGSGDYLSFSYCLSCGMIQSHFPILMAELQTKELREDEDEEE